jgi:hypothetical protein
LASFPTSIDQLTAEWLGEALGTTVNSFEAAPLGEGVGVLGLVTRVHLESTSGPATLIAKFPSLSPDNRAVADTYDMYGREYRFYTQIAPTVPLRAPQCYFAQYDEESHDFVLLLEDLIDYRIGDQVEGCTREEAHQVVASIASLHRNTWQPDHISDIQQHDMPYQREGMYGGYQVGWPVVLHEFPHLFDDDLIRYGAMVPDQINRLLTEIHDGPLVIAHGDVRLDNIFFSDAGIALVDFQAVCKAAPEFDLAYFVTQSLPDGVRQCDDWLAIYHQQLTSEGIDYPVDVSRHRYHLSALYFICYAVIIAGTLDVANERGRKLAETLLGNSLRSVREMNILKLLD